MAIEALRARVDRPRLRVEVQHPCCDGLSQPPTNFRPEGGGREYLVSWNGYDSSWNTWEPAANIRAPKLIAAFERRQAALDAPPPSKRRPAALAAAGASSSGGSGGISLAKKEGKAMVGVRVRVWWEYDAKWFAGTARRLPTRSPGNPLTVGRFAVLSSSPRGPSPPPSSP